MTILVSIASYRDALLWQTVQDCLDKASWPEQLRFAIVDQSDLAYAIESHVKHDKISYVHFDPKYSRGPCWARSIAHSFYNGEDHVLQIDAHTVFDSGWDEYLVTALKHCQTLSTECVLSSYPQEFRIVDGTVIKNQRPNMVTVFRPKVDAVITRDNPSFSFQGHNVKSDLPQLGVNVAGGFIFAPGEFFQQVPYDPTMYFLGEEQNIAVRAYTHGWDIYHYPGIPVYHLYHNHNARPMHWDRGQDQDRQVKWYMLRERSRQRLTDLLIDGKNLGVYGLGTRRSLGDFADFSGIDYLSLKIHR